MKKLLLEVLIVILFWLLAFLFPGFRLTVIIALGIIALWIVPFQLVLSINYRNWYNELSGQYSRLDYGSRLEQIKDTFLNLTDAEAKRLRWFYIQMYIFHFALYIAFSLCVVILTLLGAIFSAKLKEPVPISLCMLGTILFAVGGYYIAKITFPARERKTDAEVFNLLIGKDWRKKLLSIEADQGYIRRYTSFYEFWLQGKSLEEKQARFKAFLSDLNRRSKHGILFEFDKNGKVEVICVVYSSALNKSLAGFLKYCIEDQKVLSDGILHHRNRELLRDVFALGKLKNLNFLESQRLKTLQSDYLNLYKSTEKP